jgi:hypothetical protein
MKKLSLMFFLALAMASVLPAAIINCGTNVNINSGATTVNCAGVSASPGFSITGVTFIALGSWQDSSVSPAFTGSSTYTFTENSAQFNLGPLVGIAAGTTTADTGLLFDGPAALLLSSLDAFTVDVTRIINSGGTPANATVTVSYDWTETRNEQPPNEIPEPATFAMIGAGLLVTAVLRRRKQSVQ